MSPRNEGHLPRALSDVQIRAVHAVMNRSEHEKGRETIGRWYWDVPADSPIGLAGAILEHVAEVKHSSCALSRVNRRT
jgi:nitric oxide synthase oxygenase domain/subunit